MCFLYIFTLLCMFSYCAKKNNKKKNSHITYICYLTFLVVFRTFGRKAENVMGTCKGHLWISGLLIRHILCFLSYDYIDQTHCLHRGLASDFNNMSMYFGRVFGLISGWIISHFTTMKITPALPSVTVWLELKQCDSCWKVYR